MSQHTESGQDILRGADQAMRVMAMSRKKHNSQLRQTRLGRTRIAEIGYSQRERTRQRHGELLAERLAHALRLLLLFRTNQAIQ